MILKIWKREQVQEAEEVLNKLAEVTEFCDIKCVTEIIGIANKYIDILDDNYGKDRNPDTSLGGWIAIIVDKSVEKIEAEYSEFLNRHSLNKELAEVSESVFMCNKELQWVLEIYIVSSDYGYVLLLPRKIIGGCDE